MIPQIEVPREIKLIKTESFYQCETLSGAGGGGMLGINA